MSQTDGISNHTSYKFVSIIFYSWIELFQHSVRGLECDNHWITSESIKSDCMANKDHLRIQMFECISFCRKCEKNHTFYTV